MAADERPHPSEVLVIGLPVGLDQRRWTREQVVRCQQIRQLELFRNQQLLPAIEALPRLERLHLWGISLRDPGPLLRCRALRKLTVTLGTTSDFSFVQHLPALEELWIIRVRGLQTIAGLRGPRSLRVLWLENLPRIAGLPDLSYFPRLERLELIELPKVRSLKPVLSAKSLRQLKIGLKQADEPMLSPLAAHGSLRAVAVGTGSARRNAALDAVLGLSADYDPDYALLPDPIDLSPDFERVVG